jgi:hypothetical protein
MTAIGKITAASLRVGDVVLIEAARDGSSWVPAIRKGNGTYAVRVTFVGRTAERGRARVTLDYGLALETNDRTAHMVVSPSQTFWLGSASRKWRDAMMAKGVEFSR